MLRTILISLGIWGALNIVVLTNERQTKATKTPVHLKPTQHPPPQPSKIKPHDYEVEILSRELPAQKLSKKRNAYLLVTLYRSGSTLTGEMFNRNSDFLYFFEPLAVFGNNEAPKQKFKMLNETFHCVPPAAKDYEKFAPKQEGVVANCLREGICMYQLSTRFCQPPFCWADQAPLTQCKRHCEGPVKTKKKKAYLAQLCQNDVNTVAIKTIRFHDMTKLKPFYDVNYDLNFKAVMLIRDPRSMFHSRKNIILNVDKVGPAALPDMMATLARECRNYATSYFAVDADRQMKRKTLIIRYEDMALNPMRYVRQVYRFLGEKVTPSIDKKMQDAIAPPKKTIVDSGKATYTTNRVVNKTKILNSWRLDSLLSIEEISQIESECAEMMDLYGYKKMNKKYDQLFDLNLDFVDLQHHLVL